VTGRSSDTSGLEGHGASATVLLTDIQDSTWLWERHPDEMEVVVPEHHELVGTAVDRHGGTVITSTGDGVLAVFDDAVTAVHAAIEIQRVVAARTWPGIGELHIRIGLHSGPCKLTNGDIIGRSPNLAARLQSAGHGGQILLSGDTAAECAGRLGADPELVDLGRYLIRGFDQPVAVYTVATEGLRIDFPPLRTDYCGIDDLPPDESELVGRDELITEIERRLGAHRLVTLWGPAGVGKTRLAVRVAAAARRPFRDGIRFVDLATVRDPAAVSEALAAALRAQPVAGEAPLDTATRALGAASVLVVLDNCEQVLAGVRTLVAEIVTRCRAARVLTTSREPLALTGESTLEVRPLAVPAEHVRTTAELDGVASVRLFVSRAAASNPAFALTPDNAATVAAICRATDGVPLAVELAAARVGVVGLGGHSPAGRGGLEVPALASMSESMMRTVATLTADELELCSRVAVFNGPFTAELARGVATNPETVGRSLDRLVRTAMVQTDPDTGNYRVLAPVREFAWARLDEVARSETSWAHARLMLTEAATASAGMRTDAEVAAVARTRSQFADHRAALYWLLEHGATHDAAALVSNLFTFCLFQPQPEGQQWARMLADRLTGDEPMAADVIGAAAIGAWFAGDTVSAVEIAKRAVAVADVNGGSAWWARVALVDALGYAGDFTSLQPHYLALVAECRAGTDPYRRIYGIGLEAISLAMFGRVDDGVRRAEQAVSQARRLRNPECVHWAFYSLGRVLAPSDVVGATEAFEQAMRAAREVGSRFNVGLGLVEWVGIKRRSGEQTMAVAGTLDLLDLLAVSGNRSQLSQALREAGTLLADAGHHETAALSLLARRGMPTMPTRADASGDDSGRLAELEQRLGRQWARVRVRASALTEPELIALCRDELARFQATPVSDLAS
jgi:predicted ATPase/class 3 adenylate cyclase